MKRAVFLDRDGTIIEESHYLADPDGVRLIPGAVDALRSLAADGWLLVMVTNQSGIARGLYTEAAFRAVQDRLEMELAGHGVSLDGVYHCPHHPAFTGPCECRKPGLGLYQRAAAELDVDLTRSVYIGDRVSDVLPAIATGGTGILVRTGYGDAEESRVPAGVHVVDDLGEATRLLVAVDTPERTG